MITSSFGGQKWSVCLPANWRGGHLYQLVEKAVVGSTSGRKRRNKRSQVASFTKKKALFFRPSPKRLFLTPGSCCCCWRRWPIGWRIAGSLIGLYDTPTTSMRLPVVSIIGFISCHQLQKEECCIILTPLFSSSNENP